MGNVSLELIFRLVLAAFLGGIIGLERECRAKEAGLRTHFMVSLGSALFMVVSQFGFESGIATVCQGVPPGTYGVDISRMASQIVSGIGFLGAGMIIIRRRFVSGLTTAAGLWTTAAVGVAVGGGLYLLAIVATLITLAGFEVLHGLSGTLGHITREVYVVLKVRDGATVKLVENALRKEGISTLEFLSEDTHDLAGKNFGLRISLTLGIPTSRYTNDWLLHFLNDFDGLDVEKVE